MADFCRACSIAHFGKDHRELAGLTSRKDWKAGKAAVVICKGCGYIQVDPDGNCISDDCSCAGKPGHGQPKEKAE